MRTNATTYQLSISFDFPEQECENYYKKMFGFEPKIDTIARLDTTVAYCETIQSNCYCYCMRVKVLEITGDRARVETTKEWQIACGMANVKDSPNCAGTIWIVDVEDLAPIFN